MLRIRIPSFQSEVELDGQPVRVKVLYNFLPGTPGRTSGPPEDCYPSEPDETEIEGVYALSEPKTDLSARLTPTEMSRLLDEARAIGEERAQAQREDAAEHRAAMALRDFD